jgi:hypothetical protein
MRPTLPSVHGLRGYIHKTGNTGRPAVDMTTGHASWLDLLRDVQRGRRFRPSATGQLHEPLQHIEHSDGISWGDECAEEEGPRPTDRNADQEQSFPE